MNWFEFSLITSTDEANELANLMLFPNPGKDLFTLQGALTGRHNIEIEVINMLGQSVFSKKLKQVENLDETLDLSAFPGGSYFVKIQTEHGSVFSRKLMKK
ncbi:MAG: T9SS type A sorting domain-containing protein [Saprospiraceae bacterium]|nr:T9SS type A sorting domain-containing protein [Saprospiraceae bacterium]